MNTELDPKDLDYVYQELEEKLRLGLSLNDAEHALAHPASPWAQPIPAEYIEAAVKRYSAENDLLYQRNNLVSMVNTEKQTGRWYLGPKESDKYWPVVSESIRAKLGPTALDSIDIASTEILGSLRPPGESNINRRGLVLGYVQSGKTTNFLSLIAKAADVGYKFFIILTGITNNLRKQTQVRIEQDLINVTPQWHNLTSADQDFSNVHARNASTLLSTTENRVIAVVKKNGTVLKKLNHFLISGEMAAKNCPILIIDDEADQASINISNRAKNEQSTINAQIRRLVSLPKVAYVAYTATPFANILINPNDLEDLYPRDFIHVLPKPDGYFGTESIFGRELLSGESDEEVDDGLPITRTIPAEESKALQPSARSPQDEWDLYVPESLCDAINWFILASAARLSRGQGNKHSSMLVHTSVRTVVHENTAKLIREVLDRTTKDFESGANHSKFQEIWENESNAVDPDLFGLQPAVFDDVKSHISSVLNAIQVVTDNQKSTERLAYRDDAPNTVIAVGGNTLARGLTLEGLSVSYFVRNSSAYDTLLQMGRWFGFRFGYADLTRIWMTDELLSWFRDLAGVEADLRQELAQYASGNITPMDYQAKIRTSPYLEITSRAKAQEVREVSLSFSGQRVQTILFHHKNEEWLAQNLEAARGLSAQILQSGAPTLSKKNGTQVFRSVSTDIILDFLDTYQFHEDSVIGRDAGKKMAGYIRGEKEGSIREWSVSFFGRTDTEGLNTIDIGLSNALGLIRRTQTRDSGQTANIKSLVGSLDRLNDFNKTPEIENQLKEDIANSSASRESILIDYHENHVGQDVGHIAIYAIDKDSSTTSSNRKDLEAVDHMIGVGIFFPRAAKVEHTFDYVSALQPDEELMDIYAEQEEEQHELFLQEENASE